MGIAILGISAYYHDSAAALIIDGEIIAAAQEERFSRIKNDPGFPEKAIAYVLDEGGITSSGLSAIVFYDKPLLKFERLLETYHAFAPAGLLSFARAVPVWMKEKLFIRSALKKKFNRPGEPAIPLLFAGHHLSHAASAYYPSPFNEAAVLTIDGVGEWATASICRAEAGKIELLRELRFPHSIGLLYASFTYYLGFEVNKGEYKVMGLAPYGNSGSAEVETFKQQIVDHLVDIRPDGSILLNMKFFRFATGLHMTANKKWEKLFGFPRREPESALQLHHLNLALAIQQVTELIVLRLAKTARELTGCENLVMAGGVALNCVANSRLFNAMIFENIWIQPAAGDAGGAIGAAYTAWFTLYHGERKETGSDLMKGALLGPEFSDLEILNVLIRQKAVYDYYPDLSALCVMISREIAAGKVIGWFQGRMEFGPRALGNRSILGDPRNPAMQQLINKKIKSRESFRPFAPAVMEEEVQHYFAGPDRSPYMLFTASLKESLRRPAPDNYADLSLTEKREFIRSDLQSVIHVDFSARVQTVAMDTHPVFWQLINEFKNLTGCPMLINTSFNIRDEPVVCTPLDAYRGFINTEMDILVLGSYVLAKKKLESAHLDRSEPPV